MHLLERVGAFFEFVEFILNNIYKIDFTKKGLHIPHIFFIIVRIELNWGIRTYRGVADERKRKAFFQICIRKYK